MMKNTGSSYINVILRKIYLLLTLFTLELAAILSIQKYWYYWGHKCYHSHLSGLPSYFFKLQNVCTKIALLSHFMAKLSLFFHCYSSIVGWNFKERTAWQVWKKQRPPLTSDLARAVECSVLFRKRDWAPVVSSEDFFTPLVPQVESK